MPQWLFKIIGPVLRELIGTHPATGRITRYLQPPCPDVYIPNTTNKPVLSGAPVATITNLHILAGASVTINGTGLMQIGGTISNSGTFDVSYGAIEFNGTVTQSLNGNIFSGNTVMNLIVSNTASGLDLVGAATDTLKIAGSVSFGNVNDKPLTLLPAAILLYCQVSMKLLLLPTLPTEM